MPARELEEAWRPGRVRVVRIGYFVGKQAFNTEVGDPQCAGLHFICLPSPDSALLQLWCHKAMLIRHAGQVKSSLSAVPRGCYEAALPVLAGFLSRVSTVKSAP